LAGWRIAFLICHSEAALSVAIWHCCSFSAVKMPQSSAVLMVPLHATLMIGRTQATVDYLLRNFHNQYQGLNESLVQSWQKAAAAAAAAAAVAQADRVRTQPAKKQKFMARFLTPGIMR
jgi:hypothetical protein